MSINYDYRFDSSFSICAAYGFGIANPEPPPVSPSQLGLFPAGEVELNYFPVTDWVTNLELSAGIAYLYGAPAGSSFQGLWANHVEPLVAARLRIQPLGGGLFMKLGGAVFWVPVTRFAPGFDVGYTF